MEQLDSAERVAMEERLESSYREIREYQDTLHQSGEAEGTRDFLESHEVSQSQQRVTGVSRVQLYFSRD